MESLTYLNVESIVTNVNNHLLGKRNNTTKNFLINFPLEASQGLSWTIVKKERIVKGYNYEFCTISLNSNLFKRYDSNYLNKEFAGVVKLIAEAHPRLTIDDAPKKFSEKILDRFRVLSLGFNLFFKAQNTYIYLADKANLNFMVEYFKQLQILIGAHNIIDKDYPMLDFMINSDNLSDFKKISIYCTNSKDWPNKYKHFFLNNISNFNIVYYLDKHLMIFAIKNNDIFLFEYLMNKNIKLDITDKIGNTFLILAAQSNNLQFLQQLLNAENNINKQNIYGMTALLSAIENDSFQVIDWLLTQKADFEIKNNYNKTALIMAVEKKNKELVKKLLILGAEIEAKDYQSNTALLYAAKNKDCEMIKLLITFGANFTKNNLAGENIFDLFKENYIDQLHIRNITNNLDIYFFQNSLINTELALANYKKWCQKIPYLIKKRIEEFEKFFKDSESVIINEIRNNNPLIKYKDLKIEYFAKKAQKINKNHNVVEGSIINSVEQDSLSWQDKINNEIKTIDSKTAVIS